MKIIREFARFAVAGLFIFSGLIKLNDPIGTAIKLEEYFQVFAQDFAPFFESFVPAALFLAVFLSVLEVVLGIALIIAYRMPITSITLIVLILFFTALTFYSAYFNKVTDCGCFGDAIKLTPWESFYKDVILVVLIFVIFFNFHNYKEYLSVKAQNIIMSAATLVCTGIALMAIWFLPFIDFRAYAVGKSIPEQMVPEEGAKYEYVMERDGREYRFDSYPTEPGYEMKAANLLNPDEATPKISDFSVWNDDGEYTEEILIGTKMIFVFHDVSKSSTKNVSEMKELAEASEVETWILTSSGYDLFETFRHENQIALPFFYADATVLKAMIRSNPGVLIFQDGVVKGKWHYNALPSSKEISKLVQ